MTTVRQLIQRNRDLPLTKIEHWSDSEGWPLFIVVCRECGDVTALEGSGPPGVGERLELATLYRQRHLVAHLSAISSELEDAVR